MTRLLHAPEVDPATRRLDPPVRTLDQATRDLIAQADADAYARGRADGAQDAADAARIAATQAAAALEAAVVEVRQSVHEVAVSRAQDVVTTGRRLAEVVLGHELQAGGAALAERVLAAVDVMDHGPFEVQVAPADHDMLAGCRLPGDTSLVADPGLEAGEARIVGPWSQADLTLGTILDTLAEDER